LIHKKNKWKKQREKKKNQWYTPKINSNIYVSGLPPDITQERLQEFFGRAGVIRIDKFSGEPKVKLYRNSDGTSKGDGLISYVKEESLLIAISLLNKQEISPGYRVSIEPVIDIF